MEAEEKEIDFKYLEEKIKSHIEALEKCKESDSELVRATGTLFLGWMNELYGIVRTAIRTERGRIQGTKDHIDALLYSMMNRQEIELSGPLKSFCESQKMRYIQRETQRRYEEVASDLEELRLKMKSEQPRDIHGKIRMILRDNILQSASELLRDASSRLKSNQADFFKE